MSSEIVGGGLKKVLYTLQTVQRMGLNNSAKALRSKNTCKACAYGMGGQKGGMVNELGEFPSVCNKSVQAQSTDVQPPIPEEIFAHSLTDFLELSPKEMENLGRLGTPIYKAKGAQQYAPITWEAALTLAAEQFSKTKPERTFFYASGRSSNEASFVFQLLARAYGTNNVSNCSYYCHQATGVGLSSVIGTGTSTIELEDLTGCDLIFVIGANPSSNHPRFIHMLKACRDRGGDVVIINPAKEPGLVKFAVPKSPKSMIFGGTDIASDYLQPRIGSDLALLKGLAKAVIENGWTDEDFLDGRVSGYEAFSKDIEATAWKGITAHTGLKKAEIERAAKLYHKSKNTVFAWGMGITHHTNGSSNVEYIANLALLCGQIGRKSAGLLPLRGHSNVQGVGTVGVKPVLATTVMAKMEETLGVVFPKAKGMDTMTTMKAAATGDIDACILMGGNLLASNPNTKWAKAALNNVGFRVSLTTTLNQSHFEGVDGACLILPVTARDEEWQPTTQESMFNYVRLSDGGIDRISTVRPESDILVDLATRLLPESPINFEAFKSHQTIREAIAATVPGLEDLKDIGIAKREFHIKGRLLHTPYFNTPSQKAQMRVSPLPPLKRTKTDTANFTLTTIRSEGQFNSIIYETHDSYRGTDTRWAVLMNAEDIEALGATAGDTVTLTSAQGEMKNVKTFAFDLPRGNVMAYYPEANALTGTETDPRSMTPGFKSTLIQISQAE